MAFPTGWTKRVAVTIPAAQVGAGGVTTFTVLLTEANLPAGIFDDARSDGGDIRASTAQDGTGQLAVDVILFDAVNSKAILRVGTLSLSSAAANTIYVWYGAASETLPAANDTYGQYAAYDASWKAYWPLEESESPTVDRTSSGISASGAGTPTYGAPGVVGQGVTFGGSNRLAIGESAPLNITSDITFLCWAKPSALAASQTVIEGSDLSSPYAGYELRVNGTDTSKLDWYSDLQGRKSSDASMLANDTWCHVAVALNGSTNAFYKNGGAWGAPAGNGRGSSYAGTNRAIGARYNGVNGWKGSLDDVQIHSAARSAAWIATEYNQTNAPGTFASAGTVEDVGGADPQTLTPDGITITPSLSAPTLVPGAKSITAPTITIVPSLAAPSLTPGTATITVPAITATAVLTAPTLSPGVATVSVPIITATPTLTAPALVPGSVTINVPAITVTAVLTAPGLDNHVLPTRVVRARLVGRLEARGQAAGSLQTRARAAAALVARAILKGAAS